MDNEDFWQKVPSTKDKFFVYSAYYDDRRSKWENWNLKYSAYFILCPIKQQNVPVPSHVSIIRQGSTEIGNKIIVRDNKKLFKKPEGIAVCIKPLHYEYNKVKNLVEFVEFNRILGVNHFVLYNHTVGPGSRLYSSEVCSRRDCHCASMAIRYCLTERDTHRRSLLLHSTIVFIGQCTDSATF
ncbi:glycosyltransferase family 92 protein [Caerostris extrusa]|uniref:Glycosyltransferase family 92 protein n=1 Tax=Caerostris extrusa TaxID=172846 RepID=A0AAV4NGZ4_CAEEX|nr:glycosyltransferase family 92 protein [Caerostris extrusa]